MDTEPSRAAQASQSVHLIIVPHTHWDREWYQPFQEIRSRLVRLMDRLLDVLEGDPAFAHFHLDGQTIVLEDYLEIRPQNRARLRRLIKAERVAVGPWYVLPDEFLVSGESIIRNLEIGHRIAAEFGAPLKIGYLPDQFGHIAQMPQILKGFDIDCAVVWRGVGPDVTGTLFTWAALDGTQVLAVYLPLSGYSNGRSLPADGPGLRERLAAIVAEQAPYRHIPSLLVMNGTDHQEAQAGLPRALAAATGGLEGVSYEIAPLSRFIDRSRVESGSSAASAALPTHRGELRSALRAHLLPGVTSMRVRQKQRDFENVSRLERYAEPLATWADQLSGSRQLTGFTQWAWKVAVQNHPHDSICGCSVDQVHRDMEHRFDQVEMVGKLITRQALAALADRLDTSKTAPDRALVVYNPNATGADVVRGEPSLDETAAYTLEDPAGRELPVCIEAHPREILFAAELPPDEVRPHVLTIQSREFLGSVINDVAFHREADRLSVLLTMDRVFRGHLDIGALRARWLGLLDDPTLRVVAVRAQTGVPTRVTFCAPQLTGYGFTVFALRRQPKSDVPGFAATDRTLESEHFRLAANEDGSLTITDKQTGLVLPRCNWFVDEGDRGDEYNFDPVRGGQDVCTPAADPTISIDAVGPVVGTLTIRQVFRLPRALDMDRETRCGDVVAVPITTSARLYAGIKRVDFETVIDNAAADHRLRVHFQTPLVVGSAFMEQAFGVVERPLALEAGDRVERPVGTVPQKAFTCIQDGTHGVALFNRGIQELEVRRRDGGTELALTLIRAVGWLSRGDLRWRQGHAGPGLETPEAQSPGLHRFEYALTTFAGDREAAGIVAQAHRFAYPPIVTLVDAHPGPLPADASVLRCDNPNVVVSAQTPSKRDAAFLVRCYNASEHPQAAVIACGTASSIRAVNFLERPARTEMRRLRNAAVRLRLRPFEIVTLQVRTA
jgi:alpha-mannosidase